MHSRTDISRWLTFPLDPITIEDWLGNREYFGLVGKQDELAKELEIAYQIEQLRSKKQSGGKDLPLEIALSGMEISGSFALGNMWIIAPVGRVNFGKKVAIEIEIKPDILGQKKLIPPGEIVYFSLEQDKKYNVKITCHEGLTIDKKSSIALEISNCRRLIIDTRGRPISFWPSSIQTKKNKLYKEALNEV